MDIPKRKQKKIGRGPSPDPVIQRISVSFTSSSYPRFLSLFERSKMKKKSDFIVCCILNKPVRYQSVDKSAMDICTKLTEINAQIRSIGINYNQITKALKVNFSEKKALSMLFKVEQATLKLGILSQRIIQITEKYREKWSQE